MFQSEVYQQKHYGTGSGGDFAVREFYRDGEDSLNHSKFIVCHRQHLLIEDIKVAHFSNLEHYKPVPVRVIVSETPSKIVIKELRYDSSGKTKDNVFIVTAVVVEGLPAYDTIFIFRGQGAYADPARFITECRQHEDAWVAEISELADIVAGTKWK